jgi:hypothetical protein
MRRRPSFNFNMTEPRHGDDARQLERDLQAVFLERTRLLASFPIAYRQQLQNLWRFRGLRYFSREVDDRRRTMWK